MSFWEKLFGPSIETLEKNHDVEGLMEMLHSWSPDPWMKEKVARALARLRDPRAIAPLISVHLNAAGGPGSDMSLAKASSEALQQFGSLAVKPLLESLRELPVERWPLAVILCRIKDPQAIQPLIEIYSHAPEAFNAIHYEAPWPELATALHKLATKDTPS